MTALKVSTGVCEEMQFELWQDGVMVAQVVGPSQQAWQEIRHYALMYVQDGPVVILDKQTGVRLTVSK